MRRRFAIVLTSVAMAATLGTLVCLRPPQMSTPITGAVPLRPQLAVPDEAISLAKTRDAAGSPIILLVSGLSETHVDAIALGPYLDAPTSHLLEAYNQIGRGRLLDILSSGTTTRVPLQDLLPVVGADRHVAAGTNFEDHADEVEIDPVFLFPKISEPSPSLSTVPVPRGVLLDYEVELCLTADRPIRDPDALSDAVIGVFLCGDLTDRAALLRGIDLDGPSSGAGFADAKSSEDRFPTGPILAVPADWRQFVAEERIATWVNGELRQDDLGASMREDFDLLVTRMIDGADRSFDYRGETVPLLQTDALLPGQAILSGTPAGVIFRPPSTIEIGCGIAAYCLGGFLSESRPVAFVIERYINRLDIARVYLQPGDELTHASSRLGTIEVVLTEPEG